MIAEASVQVQDEQRKVRHPVLVTALTYLAEALEQERYEECREMADIAREFGATEQDVQAVLQASRS